MVYEEPEIMDVENYSDQQLETYWQYKEICSQMLKEYQYKLGVLNTKVKKPLLDRLSQEFHIGRKQIMRKFLHYLQEGMSDVSLLDGRSQMKQTKKPNSGRPPASGRAIYRIDEQDKKNMNTFIQRYLNNPSMSLSSAYEDMVSEKYSSKTRTLDDNGQPVIKKEKLPLGQRPSRQQFNSYYYSKTTSEQRKNAKKGAMKVRNNQRTFRGTIRTGVKGRLIMLNVMLRKWILL